MAYLVRIGAIPENASGVGSRGYRIRVVGERASDIHRSKNMAEELHVEFMRLGYGTTSDPDTMTTEFQIHVVAKRKLGQATTLMRSIISKHLMESDVEIDRV